MPLCPVPVAWRTTLNPVTAYRCIQQNASNCVFYWTVEVEAKNVVSISPCAIVRARYGRKLRGWLRRLRGGAVSELSWGLSLLDKVGRQTMP